MSTSANPAAIGERRLWLPFAAGLVVAWLLAAVRLVMLPEAVLAANVLVDDALYFVQPARNWWAGNGFSFDGLEPSNGVQALWALVALVLACVISEPLALLRSLVATSALCWGCAALGLFALLRHRSPQAATLAAVGMAWCGVHERLAFTGMENGLHALVAVLVLLAGQRATTHGWTSSRALRLGFAIALRARRCCGDSGRTPRRSRCARGSGPTAGTRAARAEWAQRAVRHGPAGRTRRQLTLRGVLAVRT